MKLKLICCEVFMRMACLALSDSPHTIDPEFTPLRAHENPDKLRETLQEAVDGADGQGYDAILLGLGLCGNATAGLKASGTRLVIPRAHDCCTLFMGSRQRFLECFQQDLSTQWSSIGYMERGIDYLRETETGKTMGLDREFQDLAEQYGEENAQFIWETLHPQDHRDELVYIEIPEFSSLGWQEKMKAHAKEQQKELRTLDGDMRLIRNLVHGNWNEDEFLIVQPGQKIKPVYDHEQVLTAE